MRSTIKFINNYGEVDAHCFNVDEVNGIWTTVDCHRWTNQELSEFRYMLESIKEEAENQLEAFDDLLDEYDEILHAQGVFEETQSFLDEIF